MLGNSLLKVQRNNLKQYETDSLKILQSANQDEMAHENKDDYIYYNFNVANPSLNPNKLLLEFDVNRIDPILKNPSEYEIGIESFEISSTLPIFIQSIATVDDPISTFQLAVEIVDPNFDPPFITGAQVIPTPSIANSTPPFNIQYKNHVKDGVYDYQQFVNAINLALYTATDIFNNGHPAGLKFPVDAELEQTQPFLRYFQTTGNFTLYSPNLPEPPNPADPWLYFAQSPFFPTNELNGVPPLRQPLQIRFSRQLAKLFSGFSQFNLNPDPTLLAPVVIGLQDLIYASGGVQDKNITAIRGVDYIYTTTQYDCRPNMNQFNTLVFETDSVPIKDELIGTQKSIVSKRLFDYNIPPKLADRSRILYNPEYIKWSNLQSNTELRQFNMYVSFESFQGEKLLYSLQPNEKFSCKVIFRKKNTLNVSVV